MHSAHLNNQQTELGQNFQHLYILSQLRGKGHPNRDQILDTMVLHHLLYGDQIWHIITSTGEANL